MPEIAKPSIVLGQAQGRNVRNGVLTTESRRDLVAVTLAWPERESSLHTLID